MGLFDKIIGIFKKQKSGVVLPQHSPVPSFTPFMEVVQTPIQAYPAQQATAIIHYIQNHAQPFIQSEDIGGVFIPSAGGDYQTPAVDSYNPYVRIGSTRLIGGSTVFVTDPSAEIEISRNGYTNLYRAPTFFGADYAIHDIDASELTPAYQPYGVTYHSHHHRVPPYYIQNVENRYLSPEILGEISNSNTAIRPFPLIETHRIEIKEKVEEPKEPSFMETNKGKSTDELVEDILEDV